MNFLSGIFARAEDNEVMGFDAVVTQLSSSHKSEERMYDPFADVKIHTSVGLISSFLQVKSDQGGSSHQGTVQGVEANLGIDLFSPHWQAEGSIRGFDPHNLDAYYAVKLKEFDLRLIFSQNILYNLEMHCSLGLAARYLLVESRDSNNSNSIPGHQSLSGSYRTPASIFGMGLSFPFSKNFSIGTELSLRKSLIKETVDHMALNGSIKVETHF
ncbi:MAG: hypothetical protein K1X29_07380 [Bdellovibrionales bacterium]|nr:hypothetical protein [Bdellovibrionales bacterium]